MDATNGATMDGLMDATVDASLDASVDATVSYSDLKRAFDRAVRSARVDTMRSCFAVDAKVAREEDRRTGLIPLVAAVQPDALSIADNVNVLQVGGGGGGGGSAE